MTDYRALAGALAAACLLSAAPAVAQNHVTNPSFEDPALTAGGITALNIPGWSGVTVGGSAYSFGIHYELAQLATPYGNQWAYTNDGSNAIAQQTAKVVVANETYVLSAEFGRRTDQPAFTPTLELWVGGTVANGSVTGGTSVGSATAIPVAGSFVPATLTWTAPASGPLIGQHLSVRLANDSGAQAAYDNVSLPSTPPAPVPTLSEWALILLGLCLAGGAAVVLQRGRIAT